MSQRPVVTPDGQAFRTLFDSVQQKQATNMDYQPPSPKTGVAWLEVKSQTPYKDIQQQLASSKQPTLLKFKQLDHHFAGLNHINHCPTAKAIAAPHHSAIPVSA